MSMHMINVPPGQDVLREVMTFAQQRPITIILSGNGTVSVATLRPSHAAGATVRHEGLFNVWNLGGTFSSHGNIVNGSLNALLSGGAHVGTYIGGVIASDFTAATLVQVMVMCGQLGPRQRDRGEASANSGNQASRNAAALGNA